MFARAEIIYLSHTYGNHVCSRDELETQYAFDIMQRANNAVLSFPTRVVSTVIIHS